MHISRSRDEAGEFGLVYRKDSGIALWSQIAQRWFDSNRGALPEIPLGWP
jgi:hypothetical protein